MPPRPWNQPNLPVYSLSTFDPDTGLANMNICTYVTKISLEPKLMLVAVYKDTKTLENLIKNPKGILQILSQDQYKLVNNLGKKSGKSSYKLQKLDLINYQEFAILKDCLSYIYLDFDKPILTDADHLLFIGKIKHNKTLRTDNAVLTTKDLKDKKIIR